MKSKNLLLLVLIMCVITACGGSEVDADTLPPTDEPEIMVPTTPVLGARVGEEFKIGESESIWIEKGLFEITLVGVIEDSRCPADVECFWEGNVKVEVLVGEQNYILTLGKLLEGDVNSADLSEGYTLRVLQVDPYPGSRDADQPYQITMTVEGEISQPYQYPDAV
jgi:hypothetical protein